MKAAVLHAPGDIRFEDVPVPRLNLDEVLIRVRAAGICGSDIPRVMVTGTYRFPTIPGHEFAGEIAEVGKKVKHGAVGDRVAVIPCIPCRTCTYCERGDFFHCKEYNFLGSRTDGGFAEYVKVPADNIVMLPKEVDFEEGACTEPLSVSLHIINRAGGINPGDRVAVFGAGPIGSFCAQWAKILGAEQVFLIDIVEKKLETARELRIDYRINANEHNPVEEILNATEGEGVDLSVEAAGTEITLQQCLKTTRKKGTAVVVGRAEHDICIPQKIMSEFLRKELALFGGWGFEFAHFPHHTWKTSLHFLKEKKIKVKPLITHRFRLKEAPRVFKMMHEGREYFHKILFFLEEGRNESCGN